jgi:hypothetical protein
MPEGFDVTAQRRGHLLRAAVVGALVSGAVLLPAAPALADVNANPGGLTLNPGEEKQISITMNQVDGINPEAKVSVSGLGNEVSLRGPGGCSGNGSQSLTCNDNAFDGENDDPKTLTISVSAKNPSGLQQGQTREGSVSVEGRNGEDSVNITLKGPQQAASASEVSGRVTDTATGDGVAGAQVTLKDSASNTHTATANSSGNYSIKSSANKPIVPGQVTVTAVKEGYADTTANGTAQSGRALTLAVRMKPVAASAEPSAPVASEPAAEDPSAPASGVAQQQKTSGEDGGTSMLSLVLIGMGVLLVLLGIGAIILLVMRRKDDGDPDDPDGYGTGPNQMAPAGAGAYGGGGATMVGGRPGMNDATAIVGPQLDEFPDPYAAPAPAPAPTRVGGAYSGGYNDSHATNVAPPGYGDYGNGGGYRDERGYGGEPPRGGYEEPRGGGYGGGDRYADQPTGLYQGNGAEQGGYPPAGGYGGANGSEYGANGNAYSGQGGGPAGGQGGYGANGNANGGANGYGGGGYEGDYGRGGGRGRAEWQD